MGDDRLVLGHRLSEWCGHGPVLEEDIALANVALDLIGQATHFLRLAGQVEGKGRDEDALAYFRDAIEYRNVNLVELPNGDYGRTIVRSFLFDVWSVLLLEGLQRAAHTDLAGIAAKAHKEARYHVRHSGEWVVRLGDGTEESHRRVQAALDELWPYTGELFAADEVDQRLIGSIARIRPRSRPLGVRGERCRSPGEPHTPGRRVHAFRRPPGTPHRAPGPPAGRDADPRPIAPGGQMVSRARRRPRSAARGAARGSGPRGPRAGHRRARDRSKGRAPGPTAWSRWTLPRRTRDVRRCG